MGFLKALGLVSDEGETPPAPKAPGANGSKPPTGAKPNAKTGAKPSPDLSDDELAQILADEGNGKPTQRAVNPKPPPPPAPSVDINNPPDFAVIYQMGKVPVPPHGYDTDRVSALMTNPRFASMPHEVRTASVMATLETLGVPLGSVVEDAVARAGTLDDYEAWLSSQHEAANVTAREEAAKLEAQLAEVVNQVRAQIEAATRGVTERAQVMDAWKRRKQAELAKLHAVAHMIDPTEARIAPPTPSANNSGFARSPLPFGVPKP